MDANSDEEDGYDAKEDDGVDEDGYRTGMHVPKLHHFAPPAGQLKQQPRAQQHEEHHCYHHCTPVRHVN